MANKDTENKRRSGLTPLLVLPKPDGTIELADRQAKVWKYAGITSTALVVTFVGTATAQRTGIVAAATSQRTGIVGTATTERSDT